MKGDLEELEIQSPGAYPATASLSMATPMGFEPTISTVTGWHVNRYTTGPCAEERVSGYIILVPPRKAVNTHGDRTGHPDYNCMRHSQRRDTNRTCLESIGLQLRAAARASGRRLTLWSLSLGMET